MAKCTECSTQFKDESSARNHCLPLEQRRGPRLSDQTHPANNGSWARFMSLPMRPSGPHGPYTGPKDK